MYGSNHVVGHGCKDHMEKLEIMTGVFTKSLNLIDQKYPNLSPDRNYRIHQCIIARTYLEISTCIYLHHSKNNSVIF